MYDGMGPELRALRSAGFALVVITNQSGLARGIFTEHDLIRMHDHLRRQLDALSVPLDGIYYCPHHVDGTVPELSVACNCRKPAPGMLLQAASELDLDLSRSWMIGDILDDVEAGHRAGCRTVLVDVGTESLPTSDLRRPAYVARDTRHALRIVRAVEGLGASADLRYHPPSWAGASDALAG